MDPVPAPSRSDAGAPVADAARIVSLDLIRGVAVLGILFANITAYSQPNLAYFWPPALPGGDDAANRGIWLAQFVLVDGKFRALFTLLFGAGMALFLERAAAHTGAPLVLQARRLAWLLLFGLAHFFLLFTGDILVPYAVAGLVVLAMAGWQARAQLATGIGWYLVGTLAFVSLYLPAALAEGGGAAAPGYLDALADAWNAQLAEAGRQLTVVREGSYADVLSLRLAEETGRLWGYRYVVAFETVPLMLIGMGLHRLGFFAPAAPRRRGLMLALAAIAAAAAANLALGLLVLSRGFPPYLTETVFFGLAGFASLPMALGYAALLVRWSPWLAATPPGRRLVAAGRMAFSNYVGTSAAMMLLFHGWALGLYGALDRVALLAAVVLGWALMLAWSQPWLARFRYGPLEWLWRCLTYGRVFPLRR